MKSKEKDNEKVDLIKPKSKKQAKKEQDIKDSPEFDSFKLKIFTKR